MRQRRTRTGMMKRLATLAVLGFFLQPGMAISADPPLEIDAAPPSPESILKRAFENQYDVNTTSTVELVVHNKSGQERPKMASRRPRNGPDAPPERPGTLAKPDRDAERSS